MQKPTISKVLKILMFMKDIKTTQLARELNLPQQTLQRIVAGVSQHPHISSLRPIAQYFSITLSQLKGEEPLPEAIFSTNISIEKPKVRNIPIIDWIDLNINFSVKHLSKSDAIFIDKDLNDKCFAVKMNDMSMEPYFPKDTILIFDPDKKIKDRSFILAIVKETNTAIFRQVIMDGEYRYLKPLNPDLNIFSMRLLHRDDVILAGLVESRYVYKDL